jgi:hypothetical protein
MAEQKRVSRRWLYAAWIGAGAIVAAYYALWRYAAGEMESAVHQWVEDQRGAGLMVAHGPIKRRGFPFFLRLHIDDPQIGAPNGHVWTAARLNLDALPYDLNRVIFSPAGEQTFSSPEFGAWRFSASDMRASIANDKARGWKFSMNVAGATAENGSGINAKLDNLVYDIAPDTDDYNTLTLSLVGAGFALARGGESIEIEKLETALAVTETAMLGIGEPSVWGGAGGVLKLYGLNATANGAEISIHGEIGLDGEARPAGALNARIEKPVGLAPLIAASGALNPEEADAAAAALALAAMSQGGAVDAAVKLRGGAATVDGVKIADLPAFN